MQHKNALEITELILIKGKVKRSEHANVINFCHNALAIV